MTQLNAQESVAFVLQEARRLGAAADVKITSETGFSIDVRNRDIESTDGADDQELELRVIVDQRVAERKTADGSDFNHRALTALVRDAIESARLMRPDEFAGLPAPHQLAAHVPDLDLVDLSVDGLSMDDKLRMAKDAEAGALDADASTLLRQARGRIVNSEGANFSNSSKTTWYGNTAGAMLSVSSTSLGLYVSAVAGDADGKLQNAGWGRSTRKLSGLPGASSIGQEAARRALEKLGAAKVDSQELPVVFGREMAPSLVRHLMAAANGEAIYRKRSCLLDKLGQPVASNLTIVDDPHIRGGLRSTPVGDEGIAIGKRVIVRAGVLESFFLDAYCARRLGTEPNGGAYTNLYLEPGERTPEEIIASTPLGFYVTDLIGSGFNAVNGNYSRGAGGFMIRGGELAEPVEEVTIGGNLLKMLADIDAIGNDLIFDAGVCAPTLRVRSMMLSGK